MNIHSIGFLGFKGGKAKNLCNSKIIIDSENVARIQECHKFLGHTIIECVEKNFSNEFVSVSAHISILICFTLCF